MYYRNVQSESFEGEKYRSFSVTVEMKAGLSRRSPPAFDW
jgi:hypothetical protein